MEKVKISKRLAEDIESIKEYGFDTILDIQIGKKWADNYSCEFKSLEPFELAKALINGYEIEETLEEKIFGIYNRSMIDAISTEDYTYENGYARGSVNTISRILKVLDITIKGIND